MQLKKNLKSQAQVITAILLVLIAITMIVIIANFAISFVTDKLGESDCIDYIGKIEFTNNIKYTCYDTDSQLIKLQVHVGDIEGSIKGFTISVSSDSSQNFEIKDQETTTGVTMFDASPTLTIPGKNEERTYIISGITSKPDRLDIYPILEDDRTCDSSNTLTFITECS